MLGKLCATTRNLYFLQSRRMGQIISFVFFPRKYSAIKKMDYFWQNRHVPLLGTPVVWACSRTFKFKGPGRDLNPDLSAWPPLICPLSYGDHTLQMTKPAYVIKNFPTEAPAIFWLNFFEWSNFDENRHVPLLGTPVVWACFRTFKTQRSEPGFEPGPECMAAPDLPTELWRPYTYNGRSNQSLLCHKKSFQTSIKQPSQNN